MGLPFTWRRLKDVLGDEVRERETRERDDGLIERVQISTFSEEVGGETSPRERNERARGKKTQEEEREKCSGREILQQ